VLGRIRALTQGQALHDAAVNRQEQHALSTVVNHVTRAWQKALGVRPTDDEIKQLLSLIRVHVLDVDAGGTEEQAAKLLLRTVVLRTPKQADTAWTSLIAVCAEFAAGRSGTDRPGLQQLLLHAGIELQVVRSYRNDIERLRAYSRTTADALANLARIRVGATEVKIQRHSTEELRRAAEEDSLLVVGEPGAGKSGALHDLVVALQDEGRDIVFLAVGLLAAHSLGELRQELGLERDLREILDKWLGITPAFLIIDALDAARAVPAERTIRELIRAIVEQKGRWRVVASIRKFDLRYGQKFQQLFLGEPLPVFQDKAFPRLRYLNIPQLSEEELAQISFQSSDLQQLIANAPEELHDLLRVPLNLRLMAELLGTGLQPSDLTPIRTQLELLDRYWLRWVIRFDGQGDARESVLRRTCEEMVQTRSLRADRSRVVDPTTSTFLHDLLSIQVLTNWQPAPTVTPDHDVITFAHHVLFDYAVARLLLRGTPAALVKRLADDPELLIVVRPSLLLHFRHLWTVDPRHEQFWSLVFQVIRTDGMREIGRLIGPAVAAELAGELLELEPLYTAIESPDTATRTTAEQALRHLVGALLVVSTGEKPRVGPDAGPWCDLLERVSRHLRTPVVSPVRSLLATFCDHPETLTAEQRASAGKTARRLLEFAWAQIPRDQWLVIHALQAVCRTFESDPSASASLLRRAFEPQHLAVHGYEEMPRLTMEVKRLIPLASAFVEEIYRTVFAYREPSIATTSISHSRILPMRSTRQQDYGMALYALAAAFPEFLASTPKRATSVLIAVIEAYVAHEHPSASSEIVEKSFPFHGEEARIRTDYSAIWDESDTYRDNEPLKVLYTFEQHLEHLAEEGDARAIHELVEILVKENRLAILWRRLLIMGARFPNTIGREMLPLAWAIPILTGYDTTTLAGEFLKAIFPALPLDNRKRIEQALLSIPDAFPSDRREDGEHLRNRLLGCLTATDLVTDETRRLLADLQSSHSVPLNGPPERFAAWSGKPYGEEEYLTTQGVSIYEEANQKIRALEEPVKTFTDKHLSSVPTLEEVSLVLPALQTLHLALSQADVDGAHPKQQDYAWDCLIQACSRIVKIEGFSCDSPIGVFARTILLEASHYPEPTYNPKYDAQFDEHPGWGRPAVRVEAAEELILLARNATCVIAEILQAIERLSADSVPAVRFQIVSRLNVLYRTAPELMWRLIERLCHGEISRGVLQGLLGGPLSCLAGAHPDQVASLTKEIYNRVREGPGVRKVRELCIDIFTFLYIWRNHVVGCEIISGIVEAPAANPDGALFVLRHLREPMRHGPVDPPDPEQDAIRQRSFDLVTRLLHSAHTELSNIENIPFNDLPEAEQKTARTLAQIIEHIGREIYFASGAYDAKIRDGIGGKRPLTCQEKRRFYREAGHILDELADVGLPSIAHHVLETLEVFIPFDPPGVFLRIGRVVQGGQKGGYQYESLAADLMVSLVERYLAEYRALLRENEECRQALLEILDIFVQAGWPSARRLTYRLEEIFR
jgi:hypothetical protein